MGKLRTALALGVALLSVPARAQTGPPIPISQLPSASAPTGSDLFYIVQGGISKNTTFSRLLSSISSGILIPPISLIVPGGTGVYIGDGSYFLVQSTSTTALSIYHNVVPPTYFTFDVNRSVLVLNSGTTVQNAESYGAYVLNNAITGVGPNGANAVGFFAITMAGVANSSTWGGNFSWNDNGFVSTGVGLENDIGISATGSIAVAFSANLQGTGSGTTEGYGCNSVQSTTIRWSNCFLTADGGATVGMSLGALATSGANVQSQPLNMRATNALSVIYTATIQVADDAFNFNDSEEACGVGLFFAASSSTILPTGCTSGTLVLQGVAAAVIVNSALSVTGTVTLSDAAIFAPPTSCGSLASSTKCLAIIDPNGNTMYAPLYGTY